ncbi:MAG: BatA domain-containing protein, partial [Planctomycetota bacterium]|nr:BatA domain-containing protein [Planctomycetota bacterium]
MSFLYPLFLAALPLIALPIVIHLVNQRRYQTMPWG